MDHRRRPAAGGDATRDDLVARAVGLKDLLAANAAEAEAIRRVPQANIDALEEAGLFRVTLPRRLGGSEADTATLLEVSAALAEGCPSTSWVTMIINGTHWVHAQFGEQAQQEIFGADPHARVAGVLAPNLDSRRVAGGVLVSGRWPYCSGCQNATWGSFASVLPDADGNPELVFTCLPMSEVTIEDTWYVAGMQGTGSHTCVVDEVFVPDHRTMSGTQAMLGRTPTPFTDEVPFRATFSSYLTLILAGPVLGCGRAALAHVLAKASSRAITYTTFGRQSDSVIFQSQVADAALKLETAELHVARAARDIDAAAAQDRQLDLFTRARVKADTARAMEQVRESIELLLTAQGSGSFAEVNPLQRYWRDANTAGRHGVMNLGVSREVWGKVLLGLEPEITELI